MACEKNITSGFELDCTSIPTKGIVQSVTIMNTSDIDKGATVFKQTEWRPLARRLPVGATNPDTVMQGLPLESFLPLHRGGQGKVLQLLQLPSVRLA